MGRGKKGGEQFSAREIINPAPMDVKKNGLAVVAFVAISGRTSEKSRTVYWQISQFVRVVLSFRGFSGDERDDANGLWFHGAETRRGRWMDVLQRAVL